MLWHALTNKEMILVVMIISAFASDSGSNCESDRPLFPSLPSTEFAPEDRHLELDLPDTRCATQNQEGIVDMIFERQSQILKKIKENPAILSEYMILNFNYLPGFADYSTYFCMYLSNYESWPKNALIFTPHPTTRYFNLHLLDIDQHPYVFEELVPCDKPQGGIGTFLKRWDQKVNCDLPRLKQGKCSASLYSALFTPIPLIQKQIQSFPSSEYFTVGIHIRSQRIYTKDFQEFVNCAMEVASSKPIRYFISSDSQEIVTAFLEKLPNAYANVGEIAHSKDKATIRFVLDFFGMLNCDFFVGTRDSVWSSRMLKIYPRPNTIIGFSRNNCTESDIKIGKIEHTHLD